LRLENDSLLFNTKAKMTELVDKPRFWLSALCFIVSIGLFTGVVTNTWLIRQSLEIRGAIVLSIVVFFALMLFLYAMLLHGILETFGALAGSARALVCVLGYTVLPFLVFTPVALLAGRLGFGGLPVLIFTFFLAFAWMNYLLIRALEIVYIISVWQALAAVLFSLILLYVFLTWPIRIGINLFRAIV